MISVRDGARVPESKKDEMTSGSKMQPNKNQFRNDFKISQSDREIPFKLTELNFISN